MEGKLDKKDLQSVESKNGILRASVQLGIPLFFYISGAATKFFNADKRGFLSFTWDKVKRLLLPAIVAIPIFLVPMLYLD